MEVEGAGVSHGDGGKLELRPAAIWFGPPLVARGVKWLAQLRNCFADRLSARVG